MKSTLNTYKEQAGWLSYEEIKDLYEILSCAYKDIYPEEHEVLKTYRNTATHRYFVGIDELTVPIKRRKRTKQEQQVLQSHDKYSYRVTGRPEYSFEELNEIINKLLNNFDLMLSQLIEMDLMQDAIKGE